VERGIYLLPNGKYAVCCRRGGRQWYRTIGSDLMLARAAREALIAAAETGVAAASPQLRFETVAGWWLTRFEAKVAAGERHARTLEAHRYQLQCHLLPTLAARRMSTLAVDDVAHLLDVLRGKGCSAKTSAAALATLHSIVRYARRHGWSAIDPVDQLEADERPRPARRRQRVLGREEIERLLAACPPRDRLMVATALYTGLRVSELLGLIWGRRRFCRRVGPRAGAALPRAPRRASPARGPEDRRLSPGRPARRSARPVPRDSQAGDAIRRRDGLGVRYLARNAPRTSKRRQTLPDPRRNARWPQR
jgi:integrase